MYNNNNVGTDSLKKSSAIAYAIGSSGVNASFYMINNYLMLFYTDVVGLAASAISLIMVIARIWDAVDDPMMGIIEDRTHTKLGKFRPWLIIGPPFLALFNILTFTVFPMQGAMKALICGICYIGAGMAYTVVSVAINGLVNRLTDDSEKKMKVITIAQVANNIGQTAIAAVLMPIILHFSRSETANARGYFWGMLFVCIVTVPMIWIAAWKCREVGVTADVVVQKQEKKSLVTSLKLAFANDQLLIVVSSTFIGAVANIGRYALLSYYLIYVVGDYKLISPVFAIMSLAQMVGTLPLPLLTGKFGKKKTFIGINLCCVTMMVLLFFVPAGQNMLVLALSAMIGFFGTGGSVTYALICDSVEYGDWKYGIRDDGLAFSLMSFSVKLSTALSGAISAPLLAAVGYVANQAQTAGTVTAINAIVNIAPAVLTLISLVPFLKYNLSNDKMDQISAELKERRSKAESV